MQKINVSIIGTSSVAKAHIKAFRKNRNACVHSICSRDFTRAKEAADRFDLIPVKSFEEICNDKTIDAVDIITEPKQHALLALDALKHKKHVLIEKPVDVETKAVKKLMDEVDKNTLKVSVISQKRFDPAIKKLKQRLDNGDIGQAFLAEAKVLWKRTPDYYLHGNGWRGEYGSVLLNQAIHFIDIAAWFFGKPTNVKSIVKKIKKNLSCNDTAVCCIEFSNNVLFNLICSTAVSRSSPEELIIYGTDGTLEYRPKNHLKMYALISSIINHFSPSYRTPLQAQINNFIEAILYDKDPVVTVSDAYDALKLVKTCENISPS